MEIAVTKNLNITNPTDIAAIRAFLESAFTNNRITCLKTTVKNQDGDPLELFIAGCRPVEAGGNDVIFLASKEAMEKGQMNVSVDMSICEAMLITYDGISYGLRMDTVINGMRDCLPPEVMDFVQTLSVFAHEFIEDNCPSLDYFAGLSENNGNKYVKVANTDEAHVNELITDEEAPSINASVDNANTSEAPEAEPTADSSDESTTDTTTDGAAE